MYKEINQLEFIINVIWAKKHKIGRIFFEIMIFPNFFIKACCHLLIFGWNALVADIPPSSLFSIFGGALTFGSKYSLGGFFVFLPLFSFSYILPLSQVLGVNVYK